MKWDDWEDQSAAVLDGVTLKVNQVQANLWFPMVNSRNCQVPTTPTTREAAKRYCEQAARQFIEAGACW